MLSAINWNAVVLTALIGVLALGCFFFGGWALAAATVFIGLGWGCACGATRRPGSGARR